MSGTMSVGGIVSGMKTDEIISKMLELARRPQTMLENSKAKDQEKLTAWQDINTRVLALKSKADSIAVPAAFQGKQVSSSEKGIVTASASNDAAVGTYFMKIKSRAQNHQVSSDPSQKFATLDANVGIGTVDITFEDSTKNLSVTLDNTNNTLTGLKDAINKKNGSVQAVIVNAGSSDSPDYRLLVTSKDMGTKANFTVNTSNLAGGTAPTMNQVVQAGNDAEIVIGEGTNPITIKKNTNSITDIIPGVTLNIATPDPTKTVKIEVIKDNAGIKNSINGFVAQYNDLVDAIDKQFDYDSESGATGTLLGNSQLQSIQMDLASAIGNPVLGVDRKFNLLSSIGITFDTSGRLSVDDTKLSSALDNNPTDVARLFSADMQSDNPSVSFLSSSADTQPSGIKGYDIVVTQAARRAQVTAGVAMNIPLDVDETLTIAGKTINLTSGMTLTKVIDEINKSSKETGVTAIATGSDGTGSGNYITLQSQRYGSTVTFTALSSLSNQLGNTTGLGKKLVSPTDAAGENEISIGHGLPGLDVAGTINGVEAKGSGQTLTLESKNNAKGLSVLVTSGAPLTTNVRFTKGVGTAMRDMLIGMTSTSGVFSSIQDSINKEIRDFDTQITDMEARVSAQEARLYAQFNAMESQLSKLQSQSSYLASQLAGLSKS